MSEETTKPAETPEDKPAAAAEDKKQRLEQPQPVRGPGGSGHDQGETPSR